MVLHVTLLILILSSSLAPVYVLQLVLAITLIHNIMHGRAFRLLRLSVVDSIDQFSFSPSSSSITMHLVWLGRGYGHL